MLRALRRPLRTHSVRPWYVLSQLGGVFTFDHYGSQYSAYSNTCNQGRKQRVEKEKSIVKGEENKHPVSNTTSKTKNPRVVDQVRKNLDKPDNGLARRKMKLAEKQKYLVDTLLGLKDTKQSIYATLDACVAWEQDFPLVLFKRALHILENKEQWHRVVQVVKWMFSKGQGTTMGTYEQLINALEKDNRVEEAHVVWSKIALDLHSVPWRFCDRMLSIYHKNNMPERLVKLFKELEAYGRKPPHISIIQKVADAYELLGQLEEKEKIILKYNYLHSSSSERSRKWTEKSRKEKHEKNSIDSNFTATMARPEHLNNIGEMVD